MRVLIVSPVSDDLTNIHVGGGVAITYKHVRTLLQKQGHSVTVLSSWNGSLDFHLTTLKPDFRMIKANLRNWRIVSRAIREHDVVVCPDNILIPIIGLECRKYRVPSIWVIHTNFLAVAQLSMNPLIFSGFQAIANFFLTSYGLAFQHILTTSADYLAQLRSSGFSATGYIDQGFKAGVFALPDAPEAVAALRSRLCFTRDPRTTTLLLFAGRLSTEKRINLLLKAIPKDFILVLVGDGELRDDLLALHGEENSLFVHAAMLPQEELRLFYKACDITVSASNFETYGMTVHESLLCGTPVVVQDGPGFRSQVVQGVNGFLVDYEDRDAVVRALVSSRETSFDVRIFRRKECFDFIDMIQTTALANAQQNVPSDMHHIQPPANEARAANMNATLDSVRRSSTNSNAETSNRRGKAGNQKTSYSSSSGSATIKPAQLRVPWYIAAFYTVLQALYLVPAMLSQWVLADTARLAKLNDNAPRTADNLKED